MKKYQISFLINPVSGDGLGFKVKDQLPEIMASFGYSESDWHLEITSKDHLEKQIQEILMRSLKVIAVGGDGTIGFVLNQVRLTHFDQTQVGLIPLGTGNDLGRTLGIYKVYKERGLLACIKRLIRSSSTAFNLWNINNQYTLSAYMSFGMDAAILRDVDKARHQSGYHGNAFTNKLLFVKEFLNRKNYRIKKGTKITLHLNSQTQTIDVSDNCSCIIANINSYAGGSKPSPAIHFDDHKLDVLIFKKASAFFFYMICARFMPYSYQWMSFLVEIHKAESLKIMFHPQENFQLDGESLNLTNTQEIEITRAHQANLLDLRKAPFHIF